MCSNVVDAEGHWSAGKALLVQTGDIVDRGPNSTALLNFFQGLQAEAAAAGGEVKLLLVGANPGPASGATPRRCASHL